MTSFTFLLAITLGFGKGNKVNYSLKYAKRMRFFTSAVSVYFEKAAGIMLSYNNTINKHSCSATFAEVVECSLIICLHCASKTEQKTKSTRL